MCSAEVFADPARDVARVLDAVRAADARSWSTRPRGRARRGAPTVAGIAGRGVTAGTFDGVAVEAVAPEPPPERPGETTGPTAGATDATTGDTASADARPQRRSPGGAQGRPAGGAAGQVSAERA